MKSRLFIFFFAFLCIYITANRETEWKNNVFTWDASGYHIYLPAVFIYNDIDSYRFYPRIHKSYLEHSGMPEYYCMYEQPGGKLLNKYAIGLAVMELPFFLCAHAYCNISHNGPADGYSSVYQWGAAFSNIFWTVLGLVLLAALLKKYFSDNAVMLSLACTALGTNLYHYTAFQYGMSHAYSFCLFAAVLYYTDKWYAQRKISSMCMLGIALGMVTITRPSNLLLAIVPILWRVHNYDTLKERIQLLLRERRKVAVGILLFLLVCSLQMSYWKYITGHWIYFSYEGEGFNFLRPHLIQGLIEYRKGWFIYTPMALMAILGFINLRKQHKGMGTVLLVSTCMMIYLVFSWRCWWYGGGFGARALVESYAILAIPLASLMSYIIARKKPYLKITGCTVFVFFIALNMFQTFQYSKAILMYDKMSEAYYWRIFGRTSVSDEDRQLLMTDDECREEDYRSKQP